jgi:hypothetical protein
MQCSIIILKQSIHRVEAYTEYRTHQVEHSQSTAYTEYCVHRVLHQSKIDCLLLRCSLSSLSRPCCTQFSTFPQLQVNKWIESQLVCRLPSKLLPPDFLDPSTSPMSLDTGLEVHLQTRLFTASKFTLFEPPSAYVPIHWITASRFARSWPPWTSHNFLDYCLYICTLMASKSISPTTHHYGLQVCMITASASITKFTQLQCGYMVELEGRQPIINTLPHLA